MYFMTGWQIVCSGKQMKINNEHDECLDSLGAKKPCSNCTIISLAMCKLCLAGYGYSSPSSDAVIPQ